MTARAAIAACCLALAMALPASAAPAPGAGGPGRHGPGYYSRHAEGWFWYEDPPPERNRPEKTVERPAPPPASGPAGAPAGPREALRRLQEALETAQARAVMEPTVENLRDFLTLNLAVHRRAERFALAWEQALLQHPELDPRLQRPVAQAAVHAWQDRVAEELRQRLDEAARRWGIWYFYASTCPYCRAQGPVLRRFAAQHGFHVLAIALDGVAVPEFPDARPDTRGWARRLGVRQVPALFLVDPRRRRVLPLGFGYMAADRLAERIYTVLEGRPPGAPAEAALRIPERSL